MIEQIANEVTNSSSVDFSNKSGSLIVRTTYPIGKVGRIEYKVIHWEDVILRQGSSSLCLSNDDYSGVMEEHEVDACIQSLIYLQEKLVFTTPENYVEGVYNSKDGNRFGAYFQDEKWNFFGKVKGARYITPLNNDEVTQTISILKASKAKLSELKTR